MQGTKKIVAALMLFCLMNAAGMAAADETISGTVKNIDLATNTVIVTTFEGKDIPVVVEDAATLAKFKDRRIRAGDDVKVKYVIKDGKNLSTYFRKVAGC